MKYTLWLQKNMVECKFNALFEWFQSFIFPTFWVIQAVEICFVTWYFKAEVLSMWGFSPAGLPQSERKTEWD